MPQSAVHNRPEAEARGQPARAAISLWFISAELAVMFVGSTLLTPLYEVYRRSFGFSELTLTLIYAVYALGNLGALLFLGRLSDQIGRRWTSFRAIALAGASTLVFLFATGSAALFVGRFLSGLAIGLASGTATAWIAETVPGQDRARASVIASAANYTGLFFGPLFAGFLVQYAPAPLRLSFGVYLALLIVTGFLLLLTQETVRAPVHRLREASLSPRIGVPAGLRAQFLPPAVAVFASFAVVGFYAALVPGLLRRDLHQPNVAVGGLLVALMFLAGLVGIASTRRLSSRTAMLGSLGVLFVSLALLVMAETMRSLPMLLAATMLGGFSAAVGYRGSLQVVNQIAPEEQRAEVISSYLVAGFLGNSLPIVGIGVVSRFTTMGAANLYFDAVIALLTLGALLAGMKWVPKSA